MDGNGRWAEKRSKSRKFGHRKGTANINKVVEHAFERGVKVISLYAFSCENWSRPQDEIDEIFRLLEVYFNKYIAKIVRNKVRIAIMGDISRLPENLQEIITEKCKITEQFTEKTLIIALNYGGRQEIVKAVNEMIANGEEITVDGISKHLYTSPYGEPDLIIRTSGEYRLSNFMLYQGAYAELYFTDVLWPDFHEKEFDEALESYSNRNRRYGGLKNG